MEFVLIMRESLRQVPVDTNRLRSTAYVTTPSYTGVLKIEAGYATNYAAPVHDRYTNKFSGKVIYHNPPTKSHFLIDPFEAALPGLGSRIAARAKQLRESGNPTLRTSLFPSAPKSVSGGTTRTRVKGQFKKPKKRRTK